MNDEEILDIDEARIIISLKNDEINNMKSSIKANQIRTNLKIADFQYKIKQLQNKVTNSEKNYTKSEQNIKKQQQKHNEQLTKLHSQNQKLKQMIDQALNQSKQKQREFKGALYEQKMKLEKQREMNYRWACQFEIISKYFDPKKILPLLQKDKLEDIATYVDLYKKYMDSQEVLKHSNLQLSTMRSQIMSEMEESFQKLSSYESVIEDLRIKNEELRYQIQQKENELILRSEEINQKNSMLEAVQHQASTQIEQLNTQLITLQKEFMNYNREEDDDHVRGRSKTDVFYIQRIQDIQRKFQMKQMQYTHQLADYEEKIVKLQQDNRQLKNQLEQLQYKLTELEQVQIMSSNNYEKEIEEQRKMIVLMQTSLKDQQENLNQLKRQNEKLVKDLNQMIISKRKLVQEQKIAEQEYRMNFISLNEEIDYLRNQLNNLRVNSQNNSESHYKMQMPEINNQSRSQKGSKVLKRIRSGEGSIYNLENSRNLLYDLNDKMQVQLNCEQARSNVDFGHYEEDPGWHQKYYALLQKHNTFIKKVFARLKRIKQKGN